MATREGYVGGLLGMLRALGSQDNLYVYDYVLERVHGRCIIIFLPYFHFPPLSPSHIPASPLPLPVLPLFCFSFSCSPHPSRYETPNFWTRLGVLRGVLIVNLCLFILGIPFFAPLPRLTLLT